MATDVLMLIVIEAAQLSRALDGTDVAVMFFKADLDGAPAEMASQRKGMCCLPILRHRAPRRIMLGLLQTTVAGLGGPDYIDGRPPRAVFLCPEHGIVPMGGPCGRGNPAGFDVPVRQPARFRPQLGG
ncbi:hypothetical protein [Zoogloea sp. LCSB751]|uniref:hypothetical protein n=1 Tax=Zoogloea sp. LCSB751 TaxID=1965277 RepID=UPI0011176180|nr:hypothetical protein [Zoogloea sp. LCSB751]